jgi:hypothetical protein
MTVNQGVLGSSPRGGAMKRKPCSECCRAFLFWESTDKQQGLYNRLDYTQQRKGETDGVGAPNINKIWLSARQATKGS